MNIIRTQSLCLCIFLGFEDYSSCDMIHKTRLNANCFLLAGNIGIFVFKCQRKYPAAFYFKEFLNRESFFGFGAYLLVMMNSRISEFHFWAAL